MLPLAFRLVPYKPRFHYANLSEGLIYGTKEEHLPLCNQNGETVALLSLLVAISSFPLVSEMFRRWNNLSYRANESERVTGSHAMERAPGLESVVSSQSGGIILY